MKILYGVVGEGMGHATRSKVVLSYLQSRGHQLKVVVSGRAYKFLQKFFDDVVEIQGLTIEYEDGALEDLRRALDEIAPPEREGKIYMNFIR